MENVPKNKTPTKYQKTFADSIQSECRKIRTRKNSVFGHFHTVFVMQRKMQTKCSLCPKEFKFKFLVKKRKNQHASQAAKICSSCHLSFKRIDHFESQKTTCVVLDSGAGEQFAHSFSCLSLLLLIVKLRQ